MKESFKMATDTLIHDDEQLGQLYEQVITCESAIPQNELEPLADLVGNNERVGRQWRLTALLASKDGAFFREVAENEEKAKALAPTIELLTDFAGLMRTMAELAECASSRLLVAGCNHENFNDWMSETA